MNNEPIGIFDSGLGGLTVVKAMKTSLPNESFIYVGDTARIPYGEKSVDTIRSYGRQIIKFLEDKNVKAIIVACGTISSNVIEDLRSEFSVPLIDVVNPGIEAALSVAKKRIGVIATAATIKSGFFQRTLGAKKPDLEIEVKACPLFVPLIEDGLMNDPLTEKIVAGYLKEWREDVREDSREEWRGDFREDVREDSRDDFIDTLILGCTHYPLLEAPIQKVLKNTVLINMAASTVEVTKRYLQEENKISASAETAREYYISGDCEKFNKLAAQIIGDRIESQKVYWG